MSRRMVPTNCVPSTSENPYRPTTYTSSSYRQPQRTRRIYQEETLTDDTLADSQKISDYYYYDEDQTAASGSRSSRISDYYENESVRQFSKNSSNRSYNSKLKDKINPRIHKEIRKIYPQQYGPYQMEIYEEMAPINAPGHNPLSDTRKKNFPPSRLSDRPQSSQSSGIPSAVIDGCGGKCQTFENICYFFLQLIFMMCILIGVSLCIAGLVLRRSAARNLQVLVYIGILLAVVSGVLLGIQWNARNLTKKRKKSLRMAKRSGGIPLETLQPRTQPRCEPVLMVVQAQPLPPQCVPRDQLDQQGIPWWRVRI